MPTPNFHDLPDGSSIVNNADSTGNDVLAWDDLDEVFFSPEPAPPSAPMTATQVAVAQRVARIHQSWRTAPYPAHEPAPPSPLPRTAAEMLREASERFTTTIDTSPQVCDPPRRPRSTRRRGVSDPDAAIRKDPNAWSMREAVELCKLLEVVVPEAGFHIALTGGLLYKEGRRKDCDLMFYQIRQADPNYEILWKYLTVAGVIRSPSYPENGWLVKATYRGKAIDCLFPNAKKAKKAGTAKEDCYKTALKELRAEGVGTPTLVREAVGEQNVAVGAHSFASNNAGTCNTEIGSVLVRHNDGAPIIYRRSPSAPGPYDPAELLATPAPAPVPAAAEAQDDIPF